ncbi:RHS repeat-associated core domain-containing protein [Bacteroides acidifaciens]|uniref:RHS repeat-associated core domain-containing protein n=2 Tax=Bacteroides acidifaciens TaxID=85831 RepID=UPI002430E949|nr:RHS repeat-associated core domain-containing protein [Bacteroides acidifaciens]
MNYLLRKLVLACMLLVAGMNLFAQESAYAYDANGNLTKDLNKNIVDIQYNCLNLPSRIVFRNGDNISNVYSGDGTKLRTVQVIGGDTLTTDYCGNAIYENGVLVRLMTDVGYIAMSDTSYHYFIKDHQGNVRVVADEDGNVEEVNDYYPFGGLMSTSSRQSVQPYKYNGKELETAGGLNWYDYGARRYDPVLGRWNGVDPSCEKHYSWSPYTYCKNNPVLRVDPDGKDDYTINGKGQLFRTSINNSPYDKLIYSRNKDISIVVNDKSLLPGMYAVQKSNKNAGIEYYNSTANLDDAVAVFKFGADNTKPEWKLDIYDDGGSKTAVVGTSGREGSVFSDVQDKLGVKGDKVVDLHSHPYNKVASDNDMRNLKINTGAIYNRDEKELFFYNSKKSRIENETFKISTSSELLKRLNDKFMK